MGSGYKKKWEMDEKKGVERGERPHKKLRFLETFLRYFGERGGTVGSG